MLPKRLTWIWPCLLTLALSAFYIGVRLTQNDFNPLALAEIGSRYAEQDPGGEPGYDGQFSYYIARDLTPSKVTPYLDVPAYRYQRILYPLLARLIALGKQPIIPWTLLGINWVVHGLATLGVSWILHKKGLHARYGLIYGLWVGLIASVGLDLHEPLAYALVVGAWVMKERRKELLFSLCLILGLFAKETTIVFLLAALLPSWKIRSKSHSIYLLLAGLIAFALWQVWLWQVFGAIGIGSGGDMATGFEWLPFMGLVRIGFVNWSVFGLFLLVFGPTILLPTLWGLYLSARARAEIFSNWATGSVLLHSVMMVFLPFSTFREPLGLVRIATGLLLSLIIVLGERKDQKALNLGLFWMAMLAMLIPQG